MSKTALQVLIEMRSTLSSPDAWTQHAEARNANGDQVSAWGDTATCFCITGAWRRVSRGAIPDATPLSILSDIVGMNIIETWNDVATRTQADVLRVIDRGIEIETARVTKHWFGDTRSLAPVSPMLVIA